MRPDLVILFEPLIDHGLSLAGCAKPFGVESFSAEGAVEALIIPIFPGRYRIDADRSDGRFGQPFFEGF
jgi:hypothetical protein